MTTHLDEPGPDGTLAPQELSPLVAALRGLQRYCRPFGSDYSAIAISLAGLDEMALHLTEQVSFYGAKADTVGPIMRWRGLD